MNSSRESFTKRLQSKHFPDWVYPIFLLLLCILAYGILIPWLGFFSDDWFLVWSNFKLGPQGIIDFYHSTRPFFSLIPITTTLLFKFTPWLYQIFAIAMHWGAGCVMWLLLRRLWPERSEVATWASALFILYPGFTLQNMALTFGNLFVYLLVLFLSFYFTVKAVQTPKRRILFSILAIVLSAINLLVVDYYFMVELVRPVLIYFSLDRSQLTFKTKLWKTFQVWLPYLILFLMVGVYRVFFLPQQANLRQLVLVEQFQAGFGQGLVFLIRGILQYIYTNAIQSWIAVFRTSIQTNLGLTSFIVSWILVAGTFILSFVTFFFVPHESKEEKKSNRSLLWACLWITGVTFVFAGLPFLTIGQASAVTGFSSRFNMPYMFGISLMVAGLIELIPLKRIWKVGLISILVAFSLGWQFRASTIFRLDWKAQERFYWQLAWRMPNLEPGTLIITDDLNQLKYDGATAVTSAVDYMYTQSDPTDQLRYDLIYGSEHPNLLETPNAEIDQWPNYLFPVDLSRIVFISYANNCPQVLTTQYPFEIAGVPDTLQPFIDQSSTTPILSSNPVQMDTTLFGPEPTHDWCYFYSKADLARQVGNWNEVVNLENQALELFGLPSSNPRQIFPLIEGLAEQGEWSKAQDLFIQTYQIEQDRITASSPSSRLQADLSSLKDIYLSFWQYLETHSLSNETKAAAQAAILSTLQAP